MGWNCLCHTQPHLSIREPSKMSLEMLLVFSFLKVGQHVTQHFVMIITYLARQLHKIVNQVNFNDYMPKTFDKNDIYHIYLRSLQNSRNVLQVNVAFDRLQQFGKSPDPAIKLPSCHHCRKGKEWEHSAILNSELGIVYKWVIIHLLLYELNFNFVFALQFLNWNRNMIIQYIDK